MPRNSEWRVSGCARREPDLPLKPRTDYATAAEAILKPHAIADIRTFASDKGFAAAL
jgi:hypothetical protein